MKPIKFHWVPVMRGLALASMVLFATSTGLAQTKTELLEFSKVTETIGESTNEFWQASTSIVVATNQVFELLYMSYGHGNVDISDYPGIEYTILIGGKEVKIHVSGWWRETRDHVPERTLILSGPVVINVTFYGGEWREEFADDPPESVIYTYKLTKQADSFTPSSGLVIPADEAGPVNVLLESSTDLMTWTEALPGSYGTSSNERYFRLRAVRN